MKMTEILAQQRTAEAARQLADRQELATLAGSHSGTGTALRVSLQGGPAGQVRLEQLAYDASVGWYVQKTFCIPRELLAPLATELRKADCLLPRSRASDTVPLPLPKPITPSDPPAAQRREA